MSIKKYFTPEEANATLPLVRQIVEDILTLGRKFQSVLEANISDAIPKECIRLEDEIEGLMAELESLGCFYKDFNFQIGLVDFPAMIDGHEVFLCWRSDEQKVQYYHGIDEGFNSRKALPLQISQEPSTF